ncbi:MAG: response regulator transcription factor [Verrucomicrobiota bacterium]
MSPSKPEALSELGPEIEFRGANRFIVSTPLGSIAALRRVLRPHRIRRWKQLFLPLGTDIEEKAAFKAALIHRDVRSAGWLAVLQRYPREFTLAIFWREDPMVFTYTTLYTIPNSVQGLPAARLSSVPRGDLVSVAVVESDANCRRALENWVATLPGYRCGGGFAHPKEALAALRHAPVDLVLANRLLARSAANQLAAALGNRQRYTPILTYRVYDSSDELFVSQPGVSGGYYFRRRPPKDLLDPIRDTWNRRAPSPPEWQASISGYIQRMFLCPERLHPAPVPTCLTSREQDILTCLCRGIPDKEIASTLEISPWTVHTHLKKIYEKLGVHSRTEAVLKFWQGRQLP